MIANLQTQQSGACHLAQHVYSSATLYGIRGLPPTHVSPVILHTAAGEIPRTDAGLGLARYASGDVLKG